MARKRKTRASEAAQQPEPFETHEPEPDPAPEQQTEAEPQIEPEQPGPMETQEEEPEVEEEEPGQEDEKENEEQETENVVDEHKTDTVSADLETKPSEDAVLQANGEGKNENEGEEEFEEDSLDKLLEPFSKDQLTLLVKDAVAKHTDFLENVQKLADADPMHRKIFVHGLGWDANEELIKSVFGKYGEIEDCRVVTDKNSGKSKGYGFILYKHRSGARRALKEPQKMIGNRTTSCQLASIGPVQAPPPAAVAGPPESEYTRRKIYVSNVSAELDVKKLVEFFSRFGDIEEGPLGLDKQTGKPRGFCLFVYKNLESAKKALEEPHKNFEGHILHCQKAVDGPKPGKGLFNQPKQQYQGQQQGYYQPSAKKGRYAGSSGGGVGHLMAPSGGQPVPSIGLNPTVAPVALGQAMAALLASQGSGIGVGNLLGGIGAGGNHQGMPPMMSNMSYRPQGGGGGYGSQPGIQGAYVPGGTRPQQGGAPYMGHGH